MAHIHETKQRSPRYRMPALVIALTLFAYACGSGEVSTDPTGPSVPADTPTGDTTDPPEPSAGPPEPSEGDPGVALAWTEAGLSGEIFVDQVIATDKGFIAYSLSEDLRAWTSEDGIDWTEAELVVDLSDDQYFSTQISAGGPGYIAIGSTFDEGNPLLADNPLLTDNLLLTSEDGLTWRQQGLDLEKVEVTGYEFAGLESVVAGPDGLVIQGSLNRIGVDEHRFVVWASADGTTWDLVEDPFGTGAYIREILATGDGFVTYGYVEGSDQGDSIWWSADGRSWEVSTIEFLDDSGFLVEPGLVVWGDQILAAVETEEGIRLWTSADGRIWEQLPASQGLDHTDQYQIVVPEIAAGPFGIVLTAELEPPGQPLPPVVIEDDGLIFSFELESGRITVTDETSGNLLFETGLGDEAAVRIDEEGGTVTILDPDTGEELTSFTFEEFNEVQDKAFEDAGITDPGAEEPMLTSVIWFSPDGEGWTRVDLEETFGFGALPRDVVMGDDVVILRFPAEAGEDEGGDGEAPAEIYEDVPDIIWVGRS